MAAQATAMTSELPAVDELSGPSRRSRKERLVTAPLFVVLMAANAAVILVRNYSDKKRHD